jgi:hypothetical protein
MEKLVKLFSGSQEDIVFALELMDRLELSKQEKTNILMTWPAKRAIYSMLESIELAELAIKIMRDYFPLSERMRAISLAMEERALLTTSSGSVIKRNTYNDPLYQLLKKENELNSTGGWRYITDDLGKDYDPED